MVCGDNDHDNLTTVAYILMVIWPIGAVLLFGGLVLRARKRLLMRTPDLFTKSTRFLHQDVRCLTRVRTHDRFPQRF